MKKLLALLILPISIHAQEQTTETTESEPQPEPDVTVDEPAAEKLRNRELGDAFRNFRPSEEITADNAVGFPTDI